MSKFETLDNILKNNNGYLKTADAVGAGISKTYLGEYVRERGLERVSYGIYMSEDAWEDRLFIIQTRYPAAIFSHETALHLLNLAEREPSEFSLTLKSGTNSTALNKEGVRVYKIKNELFEEGLMQVESQFGNDLRVYNAERTICDLIRSRRNIEIQDLQSAVKGYVKRKNKNIPLLMRYAELFSVEKIIRQYLEVLL
ncbi:MAG: type IV toxin-antitoxin system AbiEi family antitoxin domain-containing protein [Oscillospiraceae bacterium]|nr:type IV toxin-antitoxin system AbiEi family antitoxin domain-containing protein [Oscillospiraceae bacterium]